jgi:hypothetical protein
MGSPTTARKDADPKKSKETTKEAKEEIKKGKQELADIEEGIANLDNKVKQLDGIIEQCNVFVENDKKVAKLMLESAAAAEKGKKLASNPTFAKLIHTPLPLAGVSMMQGVAKVWVEELAKLYEQSVEDHATAVKHGKESAERRLGAETQIAKLEKFKVELKALRKERKAKLAELEKEQDIV